MNLEPQIVEDPYAIACHEAGHLLALRFRNRGIEKVTLDKIDGARGCFLKPVPRDQWTDFDEMLTLLAGPRAQVETCPGSIEPKKLEAFRARIIQPPDDPRFVPNIYDYTAWEHDVRPVYQMLMRPDWPARGLGFGVTIATVHIEVEKRLAAFFANRNGIEAVCQIAVRLAEARMLSGSDAEALVVATGTLESAELRALMTWQ